MQENQVMAYIPLHTFKGKGKIEEGRKFDEKYF
jgi:hypothetical protein